MGTTPPPAFPNLPGMTGDWNSSSDFSLGRLSGLYGVAEKSLDQLFGESKFELNSDGILDIDAIADYLDDGFVDDIVGPIVYIAVWLVAAVIFTIFGFIWCLFNKCACCCRNSVRGRPGKDMGYLENTDPSVRPFYSERNQSRTISTGALIASAFMAILLVAYLLMIIHTFEANEKTKGTINGIKDGIEDGIGDIDFYISKSNEQLTYVFVTEYAEYERSLQPTLDDLEARCNAIPDPTLDCPNMIKNIKEPIEVTGSELNKTSKQLSDALTSVQTEMRKARDTLLNDIQSEIDDADKGIYAGFMIFNIIYAIVFTLVLFGTVLATFSRSDGLKTGGHLMIRVAITLIFVICILVVIQMILMFIFSGLVTEIVCPAFRKLEESEVKPPDASDYKVPGFGFIMQNCNRNESAYTSFNLEKTVDFNQLKLEIAQQFSTIRDRIPDFGKPDFDTIERSTLKYFDDATSSVENYIGKCKPVYNALNSVRNLFCHNVTAPLTAFWWILQFFPVVFLFIVVTGLFLERV